MSSFNVMSYKSLSVNQERKFKHPCSCPSQGEPSSLSLLCSKRFGRYLSIVRPPSALYLKSWFPCKHSLSVPGNPQQTSAEFVNFQTCIRNISIRDNLLQFHVGNIRNGPTWSRGLNVEAAIWLGRYIGAQIELRHIH